MQKTMSWLMNNFRVGKKVWFTNDTEVSRTLGGVAYALQTGIPLDQYETGPAIFGRYRGTPGFIEETLSGVKHPDFFKMAFEAVLKTAVAGVVYKRELLHKYEGIRLHYDRSSKYRYESVYVDFNMYGPRAFLKEKKLHSYLIECCLNPEQKIFDILEHDEDCDRMDEAMDEMSKDWQEQGCENDLQEADWIEKRDYSVDYVFEKEKLLASSHMAKSLAKSGRSIKGVLTTEEMQDKVDAGQTITCYRDNNVFFFSDDYCMGVDYLPKCIVPSSSVIPYDVCPREAFPDGIIKNVEEYIKLHHSEKKQMNTVDELIDYLNATYSRATVTV